MRNIRSFVVVPSLPAPLEELSTLAHNLWWSWHPPATDLFRRLDSGLWERVGHNPVALLSRISQQRLEQAARDSAYMARYNGVTEAFDTYLNGPSRARDTYAEFADNVVAYFSAEFGLHECLPVYSGGLGVLAGDHLKTASDMGVPLIGVGLLYRHGYFVQQLTDDGWQLDTYPSYDFHQSVVKQVEDKNGQPLRIETPMGDQSLLAHVFSLDVGRVRVYLLDADIPENPPELRGITARLYDDDPEARIRQEILLGVGGMRMLETLGIAPAVCHMNEGHSAFLTLERTRQLMRCYKVNYAEARELALSGGVFTTHTPVTAGIDKFDPRLVEKYIRRLSADMGVAAEELLSLGRLHPAQPDDPFCMAVLALHSAGRINGVSRLHGNVSRGMWQHCWPELPREEVPVSHITNGVHVRSWVSPRMGELYDHYLGPGWAEEPDNHEVWSRIDDVPDAELWRVRERCRERLVATVRRQLRAQLKQRGAPPADVGAADEALDPGTLTIGFARRFAPYKRATLLLRNVERLTAIVNNAERPVQFVFAGKAHPNDSAGKELLKQLFGLCRRPELRRRMIFLENYDLDLAREFVRGVDVWLNNPLRLHEACGTSGMKVVVNGGLHLSCLDGWWPEGYDGENGWAIGDGRSYDDLAYQDYVDSESLYNLLEREIGPMFYARTDDGLPRKWIARMKRSIRTLCPTFNTHRMLREYCETMYVPALKRFSRMTADAAARTRQLTSWKQDIARRWHAVSVEDVQAEMNGEMRVGDTFRVTARVRLGGVDPAEVVVEVVHGGLDHGGEIVGGGKTVMSRVPDEQHGRHNARNEQPGQHNVRDEQHRSKDAGDERQGGKDSRDEQQGGHIFEAQVSCAASGQRGYAVRVVPHHAELDNRFEQRLIVWG